MTTTARKAKPAPKARAGTRGPSGVPEVLAALKRLGNKKTIADYAPRYGIVARHAYGVPMAKIKAVAKSIGPDHDLALELWESGVYEARLLACFIAEPEQVTSAVMDRWCKGPTGFENWGEVDTVCFALFDRVDPALAFRKVNQWAKLKPEFVRRAGFALLACLALHNKSIPDADFARTLPLIEKGAADDRNFVKKGVSWALRAIGRRSANLHAESVELARRLAGSDAPGARWTGKDALRELLRPSIVSRVRTKKKPAKTKRP